MQRRSTFWRLHLWIACFAILMNALAPAISQALSAANGAPSTWEICSADTQKDGQSKLGQMQKCAYCVPHAGSYALLPEAISGMGLFGGHEVRPFLFYRAPQPLLALTAAPPRGPPFLS